MRVPIKNFAFLGLVCLFAPLPGCSLLGFSSVPVAHLMTEDTKELLGQAPKLSSVPRELDKQSLNVYTLQPGDQILIETVDGNLDVRLPADQEVLTDGTVDLGKYGRAVVAGSTLEQAESCIQEKIASSEEEATAINVRLIQPVHRYYVIGEVNSPGAYPLAGHETVLDGIMEAGGLTPKASACDLLLARPTTPCSCRVVLPICYRAITQLGDTSTNYQLRPGDRIFVARQSCKEELFAYVAGSKTCDRCCKKQSLCCDPERANCSATDFLTSHCQLISAPAIPEPQDAPVPPLQKESVANDRSGLQGMLQTDQSRSTPKTMETETPSESLLDGELDFEELLKQNTKKP